MPALESMPSRQQSFEFRIGARPAENGSDLFEVIWQKFKGRNRAPAACRGPTRVCGGSRESWGHYLDVVGELVHVGKIGTHNGPCRSACTLRRRHLHRGTRVREPVLQGRQALIRLPRHDRNRHCADFGSDSASKSESRPQTCPPKISETNVLWQGCAGADLILSGARRSIQKPFVRKTANVLWRPAEQSKELAPFAGPCRPPDKRSKRGLCFASLRHGRF